MSLKPTGKVAAGGIAGAIVTVLVWVYGHYQPAFDLPPMTAEIAAALTAIAAAGVGWLKSEGGR